VDRQKDPGGPRVSRGFFVRATDLWCGPSGRDLLPEGKKNLQGESMARITIEDCLRAVPNRFHLVQMAATRAKQIKRGATALVQENENKAVVIALREIAAGHVKPGERIIDPLEEGEEVLSLADEAVVEAEVIEPAAEDGTESAPA
jgi:DNA-directed RNA polymerase subunit omega